MPRGRNRGVPTGCAGVDFKDSFKTEKKDATTAMLQLLVSQPKYVRDCYVDKIRNAETHNELRRIMSEVRELI